ncbi:MAG: hypothetical protein PQJ50_04705, partial [Spirochaetales bacterium]|nr:hypothetical protein [Spirochaetales bacterium]
LLSLIGTIPNLVIVLLVRDRDCEDCSSLVGLALRKLPLYITTTLAMFFRVLPFSLLALIASLGLSIGLETIGMEPGFVLISSGVLIAVIVLYGVMVYSLSVPFYLMRDIPNFRAARFSRVIFKMNYKIVAPAFGVCILFPFLGNMAMLFFLENEAANILLGFLAGYYMFLASGFFAGLFNHLFERPENEELPAENNHEIE